MAPTDPSTPNYSILSIPAYLLLAMAPHIYSSTLLTVRPSSSSGGSKSAKNIYNMANPRSSTNSAFYASRVGPDVHARWERARAAHTNMFENSAFFVSAVLAGVVARCEPGYMNRMLGWYLATRVGYVFAYVGVSKGPLAVLRTVFYMSGMGLLTAVWWEAGKKVMEGNY